MNLTTDKVRKLANLDHTADWRAFATCMFRLEDADPGYMLLRRAALPYAQKLRYVLAWCTYYNPGIAAVASEYQGAEFYDYLRSLYPTAKRASERRHFRGKAGLKALDDWQKWYPKPEAMIEACYGPHYLKVRNQMKGMTQMGDYFYWKLADIWDTVFGKAVSFDGCEKYMPKVPKQGAEIIYKLEAPVGVCLAELSDVMQTITLHIEDIPYPVKEGRTLALQEAETVCCVFKQHTVGDYRYGYRSAKAWNRLLSVKAEAPKTVTKLLDGLYAGGIWTPDLLAVVTEEMGK